MLEKKRHLAVPCVDSQNPELQHSQLTSIEFLKKGNYGILDVPIEKRIDVDLRELQLILVPGIAFDLSGGRLGYGKGYYDRFLDKTNAFKIGLCFQSQVVEKVPMENHDIRMHAIISEKGYHKI
jgi:5-formyltetrahydrofolate cyclo-ligase